VNEEQQKRLVDLTQQAVAEMDLGDHGSTDFEIYLLGKTWRITVEKTDL